MKIAALIFGLLGSLAAVGLGAKWVSDYNKYETTIAQMEQLSEQMGAQGALADSIAGVKKLRSAGYVLLGLGILAFLASLLVFKLGKLSALVMLAAAAVPGVMAPRSLAFTFLLIIAAILVLLVKPKPAVV